MNNTDIVLQALGLQKTYRAGAGDLTVLKDASMTLHRGEMVALVGPSGSGKSTLLHLLGLLDNPSAGKLTLLGRDVSDLNDDARTQLRRRHLGFIYQFHNLQPEFSALENVVIPQLIAGVSGRQAEQKAAKLLASVGLSERLDHRPARLSGGEQQRVAIVRALANDPDLLLADEPTGNLDPETSEEVFTLLQARVKEAGVAALIATHNMQLAKRMDRVLVVRQGALWQE